MSGGIVVLKPKLMMVVAPQLATASPDRLPHVPQDLSVELSVD